jgi:hypothetical protein
MFINILTPTEEWYARVSIYLYDNDWVNESETATRGIWIEIDTGTWGTYSETSVLEVVKVIRQNTPDEQRVTASEFCADPNLYLAY